MVSVGISWGSGISLDSFHTEEFYKNIYPEQMPSTVTRTLITLKKY